MNNILHLNTAKRKQLIRMSRKVNDPDTALRFRIVAKLGAGIEGRQVAKALEVVPSTVSRTKQRFLEMGVLGLYDQRRRNGSLRADDTFRAALVGILHRTPPDFGWERPTWTRELLCLEMEQQGFNRISPATMGRALKAIGARLGSPKPIVRCPWTATRREGVLGGIAWRVARCSAREPVYFVDEVDIHLNPKIGPDWMLKGTQRRVVTPGKNQKRYIAGALHAETGDVVWVEGTSKSSHLFCTLLWKLATLHPNAKRIHLVLDNYRIHDSKKARQALADLDGRIQLHFLPPYCPDSNRIERLWRELHGNVTRNHKCRTMDELMRRVHAFLAAHNQRHICKPSLRRAA